MKVVIIGVLILLLGAASVALAIVGGGDITFDVKGAGKVVFSHDMHVSHARINCTDCHAAIYTTKEKHQPVTMAQMAQGKSCGTCHDGKWAFSVKENCKQCHE